MTRIAKMNGRMPRNVSRISYFWQYAHWSSSYFLEIEDQENAPGILGEGSNAIVWPQGPPEDDEDADEVERFDNQRLMRIGILSF